MKNLNTRTGWTRTGWQVWSGLVGDNICSEDILREVARGILWKRQLWTGCSRYVCGGGDTDWLTFSQTQGRDLGYLPESHNWYKSQSYPPPIFFKSKTSMFSGILQKSHTEFCVNWLSTSPLISPYSNGRHTAVWSGPTSFLKIMLMSMGW